MAVAAGKERTVAQKLAIILATLGRENQKSVVSIMKMLSPATIEKVAMELRALGEIKDEQQREVFQEFAGVLSNGLKPSGGEEVTRLLLTSAMGESGASEMLEKVKKAQAFSSIANVGGQDLATILGKEQPSTAALILSFLAPKKTAEIMTFLDKEFREEIIVRLAKKRTADADVVERIEKIFVSKVSSLASPAGQGEQKQQSSLGGPSYVAEIFQNIERTVEEELIGSIQQSSEELANQVRDLMFTFEDISKLSDQDMQKVVREVPMDKLVIALRGAKPELSEKFVNSLSKRARQNLSEEMELMGKMKLSDIEAERRKIVQIIRSLDAAGEIQIAKKGGEAADEYV